MKITIKEVNSSGEIVGMPHTLVVADSPLNGPDALPYEMIIDAVHQLATAPVSPTLPDRPAGGVRIR